MESGTDRVDPRTAARATWILIALRAGYAYNWFDVGPALPAIGATYSVGPAEWGLLVGIFLVGAGAFQVPAGLLARKHGPRVVALWGAGLLAVSASASAFAPTFATLLLARLIAGVGAALFFSPAIGLVASLFPAGERGLPVGGFSSAFSGGAAAGVLATALLVPAIGWRLSLLLGGIGLGVLTVVAVLAIARTVGGPGPARPVARGVPRALRYRGVWAIGLAFIGLEGASFATGQFIVPFGEAVRGWGPALAGVVGLLFVLPSVAGGPVGGTVAERRMNHRTQFLVVTVLAAGLLALLPFAGLAATIAIGIVFSFAYGFIYAVMYVLPHFWREVPREEIPLAIGLFNSMQLAGGAGVAAFFGVVVALRSYAVAWEVLALIQVGTLLAILALPPTPAAAGRPPAAADGGPP